MAFSLGNMRIGSTQETPRGIERGIAVRRAPAAPERTSFEDATEVTLSSTEQAGRGGLDRALRRLSNASSFVSVAQNATEAVSDLVSKAQSLNEQILTEVDPTKRSAMASDAATLLSQIDTVAQNATYGGESVINRGIVIFSVPLKPGVDSSENTAEIAVANAALSRANLGIDSLSASTFSVDNYETTKETLENVQRQISTVRAALASSEQQIGATASQFGIDTQKAADAPSQTIESESPEQLAQQVAQSVKETVGEIDYNLDPAKVQQLLTSVEDEEEEEELPFAQLSDTEFP